MRSHQVILRQLASQGLDSTKAYVADGAKLVLKDPPLEEVAAEETPLLSHFVSEEPEKAPEPEIAEVELAVETAPVNPHIGSTLDSLFVELGEKEEVDSLVEEKIALAEDSSHKEVDEPVSPPPAKEETPPPAKKAKPVKSKK